MAFIVEEKGDRFIVSNKNTGRVMADHGTKEKAIIQAKALNVNENSIERIKGNIDINTEE